MSSRLLVLLSLGVVLVACAKREPAPEQKPAELNQGLNTTLKEPTFSDANGWDQVQHYSTLRFPDVTGDGRSDVCGRGIAGIHCAVDDGSGALVNQALWSPLFSDATGGNAVQYYSTIQFPNVNGGSRADVCGRGIAGVWCALSNGTSFDTATQWNTNFSDANGWNQAQYYSTISFPDLNNDGRADLCGRGVDGILCGLSNGTSFATPTLWSSAFSNANGFTAADKYLTIRFADLNADGRQDVCGRRSTGIWCALSTGTTFATATSWQSAFSDANGWTAAKYYSTIQLSDVNNDNRADLCAHGIGGILCALSNGTGFGTATLWSSAFGDAGWDLPDQYETIRISGGTLCGRGPDGLRCAFSNETNAFVNLFMMSWNEANPSWTAPQYYKTIRLTSDMKLAGRGAAGIYSTYVFPADQLSISSTTALNTRRTALINKVWTTSTINTTQGVDSDTVLSGSAIDVQPLPSGTTVRRYKMNMPTSGGAPQPGGQARVEGLADHFIPSGGSSKLMILNPGHACRYTSWPYQDAETVIDLLNAGYAVLATYMPLYTPLECAGENVSVSHDSLFDPNQNLRPAAGLHPISYFLDPVRRSLNYVLANFTYNQINMAGLSGGGWTTTFYAALDTRITTSVPIAGSEPSYMRPSSDAEQENAPAMGNDFFRFTSGGNTIVTSYKDLYVMGAAGPGRRQIQVLNRNDDCCFGQNEFLGAPAKWDQAVRAYEVEVRERLQTLGGGGSFRVEINEADDCVVQGNCGTGGPYRHEFSKNTRVAAIIAEADGAYATFGANSTSSPFARGANGNLMRRSGSSWLDTGLAMVGTPSVVTGAISGHTFDVFYRDRSNRPVHAYFNGTSWTATSNISGIVISDPVAVSWGAGRIDVVALGTDYKLYHWRYDGSWSPFELVHSTAMGVGSLALTSAGTNKLDIFFRGHDAGLYHIRSNGGAPFTLASVGATMRGFPSAISSGNTLWSYFTGTNGQLYEAKQTSVGGAWTITNVSSATGSTSTQVLGTPAPYRASGGQITAYARVRGSQPNQLGVFTYSGSAWSFSNQGGEPLLGSPTANSLGAFIVSASNQNGRQFTTSWTSLSGFFDR